MEEGIGVLITFYILAGIAIISAILAVSLKNLMHCIISLALLLLTTAGFYILLFAEFIAMVQILIYIGAVIVLFLFLLMLTYRITDKTIAQTNEQKGISFILCGLFLFLLISVLTHTTWNITPASESTDNTTSKIGTLLLSTYVLPFELVSVVLLACLIGAIVIARKEEKE